MLQWFSLLNAILTLFITFVVELLVLIIQTIQLPRDNQCLWDGGMRDSQRHFRRFCVSQSQRDVTMSWWWVWGVGGEQSEVSSSIKRQSVCSQWDIYALREQWSKTSSLNPKSKPPFKKNKNLTPFKPIYKHYLYFVHTLVHVHTHTHAELVVAECFSDWHHGECPSVVIENQFFRWSAGMLKVQHTDV